MKTIRLLWITAILTLSGNALLAQGAGCNNPIVVTSTEPFFEGFDELEMPECWTQTGDSWNIDHNPYNSFSGTFCVRGRLSYGSTNMLVSPWFDLSALPAAQLVFYQLRRSASYYGADGLNLYYRTSDTGSWQPLASYTAAAETWTETVVPLSGVSGMCQVAFSSFVNHYAYGCCIDEVYIGAPLSCSRVYGLDTTVVTAGSITLVWQDTVNTGATYTVSWWSDMGDTLSATISATTATISGLGGSTLYHFAVVANCGGGGVSLPMERSFRTAAGVAHVPYCERFEWLYQPYSLPSGPYAGTRPRGWTVLYGTPYSADGAFEEERYINAFEMGGAVALPPMDRPTGTLQVRFGLVPWGYFTEGFQGTFSVGYMTDLADSSTYVNLASWANNECFWYEEKAVLMIGAPDSAYIVLRGDALHPAYFRWYIDDLVVETIPACTRPMAVRVAGATTSSIDLIITGLDDNYRVQWAGGATTDSADISDSVYTITGLAPNTQYFISVATRCTDGTLTPPITIRTRTECLPHSVPYADDFEMYPLEAVPYCWIPVRGHVKVYDWSAGGQMTHTLFFTDSLVNAVALPQLDMPTDSVQVRFGLLHYRSDIIGTFSVGYMTDLTADSTFVPLDSWTVAEMTTHEYLEKVVPMCGAPSDAYIVMRSEMNSGYTWWSVDNLVVEPLPACPRPTRLAVTSIGIDSISVTFGGGCSDSYILFITDSASYSDVVFCDTAHSYTFTGLDQVTRYSISVVIDCGSVFSDPLTVFATTKMEADTMPYFTGFEAGQDIGWRCINAPSLRDGDPNRWVVGSAVNYGGAYALYISDNDGDSNHYDLGNQYAMYYTKAYAYKTFWFDSTDYEIYFDWHCNGGNIRVFLAPVSTDFSNGGVFYSGVPAQWIAIDSRSELEWQTDWQPYSHVFTVDNPGYYHLVLCWSYNDFTAYQPPAAIDNIGLYPVPCPVVRDLTVDTVTQNSVGLSWTPFGSETEWSVTVGGRTTLVSSPTYYGTGLEPTTTYTASVRPICGEGDTGEAVSRWFTTTLCDAATVMQNYDSTYVRTRQDIIPFGFISDSRRYSYAQTIIPASFLDTVGSEIRAFSFEVDTNMRDGIVEMQGVEVYMANVSESTLDTGFIHPDATHRFVQVIVDGDFSTSESGVYTHSFDTNFLWDGHSNILLAVRRNQPTVLVNRRIPDFTSHQCNAMRARYVYSEYDTIDMNTVTGGVALSNISDIYLVSCPQGCEAPTVTDIVADNENVTVWFDAYDTVEAYITTAEWDDNVHGAMVPHSVGQYTFTGLIPMVHYNVGVRQVCNDSSYSPWVVYSVTTLDMGCQPPSDFTLGDADYVSQPFSWTPAAGELTWQIHVFNAFTNTTYNTTVIPATVGGLRPGTTYQASIRSLCGLDGDIPGPWGDTLTFTTVDCPSVTGVSVSNVTDTSATVSWHPAGSSVGYKIYYGPAGFYDAEAEVAVVDDTATSYTIIGLNGATAYEAYVLNLCTPTVHSGVFEEQRVSFTTNAGIDNVDGGALVLYPNPTSNSVTLKVSGFDGPVIAQMVDMNGRVCGTWPVGGGLLIMDVSRFAPGAYFLRVTGANGTAVKKLVVRS